MKICYFFVYIAGVLEFGAMSPIFFFNSTSVSSILWTYSCETSLFSYMKGTQTVEH